MYIATFSLEHGPWLIRVDVITRATLLGPVYLGRYTTTDVDGDQSEALTTLGPDTHGVGLPTLAVINLIQDLHFGGVDGGIDLAHATPNFTQEHLDLILSGSGIGQTLQALTASATIQ